MSRKSFAALAFAGSLIGMLAAAPAIAQVDLDVEIGTRPPPPRVEEIPAPRPGFFWVHGFWYWDGHHHVWAPGRWEHMREHARFEPAHWAETPHGWHFFPGHWVPR